VWGVAFEKAVRRKPLARRTRDLCLEIVCGSLLLVGLLTRLASTPLLISISVAIATTKIPMLAKTGFWGAVHEARTDFCMLVDLIFLLIVGGGPWSADARLSHGDGD
jgi:uncharacterized membrane protein YphA (DoxX/SURF4 family)